MIFPKLYPKIEIKEKSNEQRIKELEDMVNLLMKEKMVNVYFFAYKSRDAGRAVPSGMRLEGEGGAPGGMGALSS